MPYFTVYETGCPVCQNGNIAVFGCLLITHKMFQDKKCAPYFTQFWPYLSQKIPQCTKASNVQKHAKSTCKNKELAELYKTNTDDVCSVCNCLHLSNNLNPRGRMI